MSHKVLIVDDSDAARRGLAEFLRRSGFDVVAVASYQEGRSAMKKEEPDLLIADVRLGEFNGLQLLTAASRRIPAIVVSGFPDPVIEADARHMGAAFLMKPVAPSDLLSLVRRLLAEREAAARPERRWARKQVSGALSARIGAEPARLLDVSYGGLRLELDRPPDPLPASFTVELPSSGVSVDVDLVWTRRVDDEHWMCGGAIAENAAPAAWYGLVDAVA